VREVLHVFQQLLLLQQLALALAKQTVRVGVLEAATLQPCNPKKNAWWWEQEARS